MTVSSPRSSAAEAGTTANTINSVQSGVKGTVTFYIGGNDRYRVDSDFGKYGYIREAVNGNRAWVESSFAPFEEYYGKFLEQEKREHPAAYFGDWRDFNHSISMLGAQELDGNEVYALKLERDDLPPITIYVDTTTGDVLKVVIIFVAEGGVAIPIVVRYEDYRVVNGVRIPFRSISSNENTGRTVLQYESIEVNLDIDQRFFTLSGPN